MSSTPNLKSDDQFIVGRKQNNLTYKTTFEELKHDIGIHVGSLPPGDPIDGSLWVNTSVCPITIEVWDSCAEPPSWQPIDGGASKARYLQKDSAGNVYVNGDLYLTGELFSNDTSTDLSPSGDKYELEDGNNNVTIAGYVKVSGSVYANSAADDFEPDDDVELDASGNLHIDGHLVVSGNIYVSHTFIKIKQL
jgi:hypothetical protein